MRKGIAIYFEDPKKEKAYLKTASNAGFDVLFTSLHLPEVSSYREKETLIRDVLSTAKALNYEVIADINRKTFSEFSVSVDDLSYFKNLGIDVLRLDYGLGFEEIVRLSKQSHDVKIQLNASTLSKKDYFRLKRLGLNEEQIFFGHNFYPRKDTGLSWEQFASSTAFFQNEGFEVMAFIPSRFHHRGPVYEGLPTVERHREQTIRENYLEMLHVGKIDLGIVPEPLLPESELTLLSDEAITLEVEFFEGVSELEKEIVLGMVHRNRMDFNGRIIRSNSSRAYAQKAKAVSARLSNRKRSRYFVTIDNEKYARYSGELQILLDDFDADERVNIVGKISEKDQRFLSFIKEGSPFRLIEKTKGS